MTKEDVERLTGRKLLDPVEETVAELSTCSFGDPASPKVGGRSLSRPVTLSVFTGGNNYYAGPVAQTSEVFEMAAKNAGQIEPVSGLGDKAHWAGRTLRILRGPYLVEVEVDVGEGSRTIAEKLAATAVGRLP